MNKKLLRPILQLFKVMNIDLSKRYHLYAKPPEIKFIFTEDCANNRHNRRKQKAKEHKNNKKNGKYYN